MFGAYPVSAEGARAAAGRPAAWRLELVMKAQYQHSKKPAPEVEVELEPITIFVAKARKCLMCGTSFQSEWAGHRVCPKCRSRSSWREGVA